MLLIFSAKLHEERKHPLECDQCLKFLNIIKICNYFFNSEFDLKCVCSRSKIVKFIRHCANRCKKINLNDALKLTLSIACLDLFTPDQV